MVSFCTLAERDGADSERLGAVGVGHAEADGEVNGGDGPQRVANGVSARTARPRCGSAS